VSWRSQLRFVFEGLHSPGRGLNSGPLLVYAERLATELHLRTARGPQLHVLLRAGVGKIILNQRTNKLSKLVRR
jgi:hypothetical protein